MSQRLRVSFIGAWLEEDDAKPMFEMTCDLIEYLPFGTTASRNAGSQEFRVFTLEAGTCIVIILQMLPVVW